MFDDAVIQVLKDEGGYFNNKVTGEIVNFGITLSFVRSEISPNVPASFIQNLSVTAAKAIYQKYFWNKYSLDKVANSNIASLMFYLAVNQGPPTMIRNAQQCCVNCGSTLSIDGVMGQQTVEAINHLDSKLLGLSICQSAEDRYREVARNPKLMGDLAGWLVRLNRYRQTFKS